MRNDELFWTRRSVLTSGFGAFVAAAFPLTSGMAAEASGPALGEATDFSHARIVELARKLAEKPYVPAPTKLPPVLRNLTYDQYRDIRYRRDAALFAEQNSQFKADLFHAGFYFTTPVSVYVIDGEMARPVRYSPDLFNWGKLVKPPPPDTDLPFSGFRLRHPINRPDVWDEFTVFQGASYFRAVAKGQLYGLSARGLAIKTGDPVGEEFPAFTRFWLEEPKPGAKSFTCYALLESASCTGIFSYLIRPGARTTMDIDLSLFPRQEMASVGLAPLTSMFLFESSRRNRIDDFRTAVHDSDGLEIRTGQGEHVWRPLCNPRTLQISSFADQSPMGFGLVQRARDFQHFQDLEARYEKRPSAWIEPIGDWGPGSVMLVEIPTQREVNDNIVAFWRPKNPIPANTEFRATYRLSWCDQPPSSNDLAKVTATRIGPNFNHDATQFVVDFGPSNRTNEDLKVETSASKGDIRHATVQPNPETGGHRAKFELAPQSEEIVELRLRLVQGETAASETWLYRWIA